jgi:EmrB/QacA subfamily drug resistance transporter
VEYKWTVLTVTTVGVLMAGIDGRILIIGLPQIASAMHADAEQAIWFTQGYALASTIMLLLIGRVTDIFGRVKFYNAGFVIFTIASLLTGFAQSPNQIIVFRLVQGLGSSIIWSNSIAMIADATPRRQLGLALGINSIAFNLGSVFGLTVSGLILAFLDWRYLFYINVPIGLFGTIWAHARLKEIAQTEKGAPVDWPGFGAFVAFITSLLLAMTYAAYGIAEETVVEVLLVVSVFALIIFVRHERRTRYPLLDLKLLRIREFGSSVVALVINVIAFSSLALLLSLYFQLVVGLSPLEAGIRLLPLDVSALLVAPLSGKMSDRFGQVPFIITGLCLVSIGTYMFSTVDASTPYLTVVVYMILLGVATSMFLAPNVSYSMTPIPAQRRGVAASVRATFFNVGLTVSLNLVVLVMTFTVPYSIVTAVISSVSPVTISSAYRILFMNGLRSAYSILAALNALALVPVLLAISKTHNPASESISSQI